jgi:integrase
VPKLTQPTIKRYQAGPKRRRIRDDGAKALFLIIEPSGHKAWQMRFRTPTGRIAKITLGPFQPEDKELEGDPVVGMPLTLKAAHELATKIHRQRALGVDVAADHKARKHRQCGEIETRSASTYAAAAKQFIEEYAKRKTRRWYETAKVLGLQPNDLTPIRGGLAERWLDKPVRDLDGHDIWGVIDEARRFAVPGIAPRTPGLSESRPRALFNALSAMFGWLLDHRKIETNPCLGVAKPDASEKRERVLSDVEIVKFWNACDQVTEPFGKLFRLLLLTGCRLNEVARMRRSELGDDGIWTIPGSRTKNHRTHVVHLSQMARDILASVNTKGDIVFTTTGTTAVSGWSSVKRRLDDAINIPAWRLHDLRRTFVTGLAELGVRPDVIELCVNHVSGSRGGIAGTYNRSELKEERRAAFERWASHVAGLVSGKPANITDISKRRRRR